MTKLTKYMLIAAILPLTLISISTLANPTSETAVMSENTSETVIESSIDQSHEVAQGYDRVCIEAQSTPYTCAQWKCIKPCIPGGEACILMGTDVCKRKVSACERRCGVKQALSEYECSKV